MDYSIAEDEKNRILDEIGNDPTTDRCREIILDLLGRIPVTGEPYDPEFGDAELCKCGHTYYRHFDPYENMSPVGCKYCICRRFERKDHVCQTDQT